MSALLESQSNLIDLHKERAMYYEDKYNKAQNKIAELEAVNRSLEIFLQESVKSMAILKKERDEEKQRAEEMSESNQVLLADVRFYRSEFNKSKKANT
jgi:3-phosphoglycerate kinase